MAFRWILSPYWWAAVLAAALAAAAAARAAWLRRRSFGRLTVGLLALRLAALASLVLFFLGPTAELPTRRRLSGPVAVIVDASASMDYAAAAKETRLMRALAAARLVAAAVRPSGTPVLYYDFAADRRVWGLHLPSRDELRAGARGRSRAGAALAATAQGLKSEAPAAFVVLSDGVWDDDVEAAGFPPCYTLAVADRPPPGTFAVEDVRAPAVVLPGTPFDCRLRYSSTLVEGASATVTVEEEGGAVNRLTFATRPGHQELTAAVTAGGAGDRFFRARSPRGDLWFHTRVLDRPLILWYREMAGDADFAFLRRALAGNDAFDVRYRLDVGGVSVPAGAQEPTDADVVIYGNPRPGRVATAEAAALEDFVAAGGGLLVVLSARPVDAAALARGPLGRLLPVQGGGGGERPGGQLQAPSYPGGPAVAVAPPAVGYVWAVGEPKPGATAVWRGPDGTPALVIGRYGLGRVGVLAAGGMYRFQLAGGGDALARVAAALVLALYAEGGEPLTLSRYVTAPDEALELTARGVGEPTVAVAAPGGGVAAVAAAPAGKDVWSAELIPGDPGRYDVTARFPGAGGTTVAKASFLVTDAGEEARALEPRPERLAALAAATGGRAFGPDEGATLAAAVAARIRRAPEVIGTARRTLWPPWLAFGGAVFLLAVEWFLRRRAGGR